MNTVMQKHLARRLALSPSTVSRALRNHVAISPETREQVLQAARELGYAISTPTRSKAGRRASPRVRLTHLAALFVGRNPDADRQGVVASALHSGLASAAQERYATVHLCTIHPNELNRLLDPASWPPVLCEGLVEGLVLHGDFPAPVAQALLSRFALVSLINRPPVPIDCIDHDDQAGARRLVQRLVEHGHRKIGFVGTPAHPGQSKQRQMGYIEGLLDAGLPFDARLVFASDSAHIHSDEPSGRAVAAARDGVTAFVCAHDDLGYRLGALLLKAGLRVPDDVSLCGFDHLPPPLPHLARLTSIAAPFQQIAAAAVDRLMARLETPKMDAVRIVYPCDLCPGDSVARVH